MRALLVMLFFLGPPFWETKTPDKWTDVEIGFLLTNSPWAQGLGPNTVAYFATAAPVEEGEAELRFRKKSLLPEPDADYSIYLSDHRDENFVLAIPYPMVPKLGDAKEQKNLEKDTSMTIGRKTYHMVGHFPPTPSDPVLRLIFPREIKATDKRVKFRLYLVGMDFPDRDVEFEVKDMMYRGKLTY
jgi:hypothetical protein